MGNQHFRYFDQRIAEAITTSGQLSIKWIEKEINRYLNELLKTDEDYVVAVDTDSVYITTVSYTHLTLPTIYSV